MNISPVSSVAQTLTAQRPAPTSQAPAQKPDGDGDHGVEPGKGKYVDLRG